jgi:apolipoprotein N-acyltransferase
MHFVREGARVAGGILLTGTLETEQVKKSRADPLGLRFYNAAWMFAADGSVIGGYRKQHLVPFGEYIPLDKYIPILQKLAPTGVSCTAGDGPSLIDLPDEDGRTLKVGSLICFEDTVPSLSRKSVKAGAGMLALMTNDAWFNGSIEPVQHMHQSAFRAVECGVPLVRSANSGVSCVVDAVGRITQLTSQDRSTDFTGFLMTQVRIPEKKLSAPYVALGDWTLAIPGMLVLLVIIAFPLVRFKR